MKKKGENFQYERPTPIVENSSHPDGLGYLHTG